MENQQQQQSTTLCRTGCGFFGSPANEGLCSKCYKDQVKQEQDAARLTPTVTVPVASSSTTAADLVHPAETPQTCAQAALASSEVTAKLESDDAIASQAIPSPAIEAPTVDVPLASKKANRCLMCKKRVGLTGFTCRCGGLYCGEHRYDKAHNCSFDYKTMEREEIRKNNPVVVSDKIARL